jgi:hypothetical protein
MPDLEYNNPVAVLRSDLREITFRANPNYQFVLLEKLPDEQQKTLSALRNDPEFSGLLIPSRGKGLTTKAVCHETVALLEMLKQPGRLPLQVLDLMGGDAQVTLGQLVLDGILQVAEGSRWLCGPAACRPGDQVCAPSSNSRLHRLSAQALQHAASLKTVDAAELYSCLYQFNTLPLSPAWLQQFPDQHAVEECLQIQTGGKNCAMLERCWSRVPATAESHAWLSWTSRTFSAAWTERRAGYKLYLSPHPSAIRDAFSALLPAISAAGAHHFKIGADARGLLRPDKIVAYFNDRASLEQAAARISEELRGCLEHGVPFTAGFSDSALLSYGSDPPFENALPLWLQRQSWRQWITQRLGCALAVAKNEPLGTTSVCDFALLRLGLEGVDTTEWTPASTAWQSYLSAR